jgi:hypothetical protein
VRMTPMDPRLIFRFDSALRIVPRAKGYSRSRSNVIGSGEGGKGKSAEAAMMDSARQERAARSHAVMPSLVPSGILPGGQFRWKAARERSKMAISCFAMTPRPIPFFSDDPKPAT